jgi:hypothetical protein
VARRHLENNLWISHQIAVLFGTVSRRHRVAAAWPGAHMLDNQTHESRDLKGDWMLLKRFQAAACIDEKRRCVASRCNWGGVHRTSEAFDGE